MYTIVQGTRTRDKFIVITLISSNQLISCQGNYFKGDFGFLTLLLVLYYCIHNIASLLPDFTISRVWTSPTAVKQT